MRPSFGFAAGRVLLGREPQKGGELPRTRETGGVLEALSEKLKQALVCPARPPPLCRAKSPPLNEGGAAHGLETIARCEMPLLVKVIVNRTERGSELLQAAHLAKPQHRALSSSKRLVRVFDAVVSPAAKVVMRVNVEGS